MSKERVAIQIAYAHYIGRTTHKETIAVLTATTKYSYNSAKRLASIYIDYTTPLHKAHLTYSIRMIKSLYLHIKANHIELLPTMLLTVIDNTKRNHRPNVELWLESLEEIDYVR